jgi:hypothetical protein
MSPSPGGFHNSDVIASVLATDVAPNPRVEINNSATAERIQFFTGIGGEVNPGQVIADNTVNGALLLSGPDRTGGTGARLSLGANSVLSPFNNNAKLTADSIDLVTSRLFGAFVGARRSIPLIWPLGTPHVGAPDTATDQLIVQMGKTSGTVNGGSFPVAFTTAFPSSVAGLITSTGNGAGSETRLLTAWNITKNGFDAIWRDLNGLATANGTVLPVNWIAFGT